MKTKSIGVFILAVVMVFMFYIPASAAAEYPDTVARPADLTISIDGNSLALTAYAIDGQDYFKLRDLAQILCQTRKSFNITWNQENDEIYIYSDSTYKDTGGEPLLASDKESRRAAPATARIYLDNPYHELNINLYRIGDNHYSTLLDLAEALNFYAAADDEGTMTIDTWAGYAVNDNKIYYSDNIWLRDEPLLGVKSTINTDIDGDGEKETAQIVVGTKEGAKWTLVYKDGDTEVSVPVFAGNESGMSVSLAAGHIIHEESLDFLVTVVYGSTIGRLGYELYNLQDGAFKPVNIEEITAGTEFDIKVDEDQRSARITAFDSEITAPLSDLELADYKFYGQEFARNFFIELQLQSVAGRLLPDLVTTEMIVIALPLPVAELHTTYRYTDGEWMVQKVDFK